MNAMLGTYAGLLALMAATAIASRSAGRAFPRASYVLSLVGFLTVIGLWVLMLVDTLDAAFAAFGLAVAGAASLLCLSGAAGLLSGAMKSKGPLVGLVVGLVAPGLVRGLISGLLAFGAIPSWLLGLAHPLAGGIMLLMCVAAGAVVPKLGAKPAGRE